MVWDESEANINNTAPGKLLTQCNARFDVTISTLSSSNGNLVKRISPEVRISSSKRIFLDIMFCKIEVNFIPSDRGTAVLISEL